MKNLLILLAATLCMSACSSLSTTKNKLGSSQPSIVGTNWILSETVKGDSPTMSIEVGKINGNAGCNSYFGSLITDPSSGSFSTSQLGSTKKMCDNISVENNFLAMLGESNKYIVNGNVLELYKDNLLLLKLTKKVE